MPEIHDDRRRRLSELLTRRGLDAALVTDLNNLRYLTGFSGSNGAVLVPAEGDPVFATDGRYIEQGRAETGLEPRLVKGALAPKLPALAVEAGCHTLAVETHDLTVDQHGALTGADDSGTLEFSSLDRAVELLRTVKDADEIAALREACDVSTRALERLIAGPVVERTELDLARELDNLMLDLGGEAVGFDTIMASGPNSSIPHHQPSARTVRRGDLLKIDFGARVRGYHADCTRTFVVGSEPTDWQLEIYAAVQEAQAVGVGEARPGAETKAVFDAVVATLEPTGHADKFVHGLGHGVGLEIHEDPFMGETTTGTLPDRTAITIEPGVYLPGLGGVRIEDTLIVHADAPEILTTASKELRVID
ncbi:MAG TPA: Xaa-Pro peptidase family protein [Nocardioidaceae bacterium]|nr:Xaa-Pro peptidase family protein [Nocardioidaceae bacterium]